MAQPQTLWSRIMLQIRREIPILSTKVVYLFIVVLYFVTAIPLIRWIIQVFRNDRKLDVNSFKELFLFALPLILWSSWMYYIDRTKQLDRVGIYYLTSYPDCDSCILKLESSNNYYVLKGVEVIEQGEWRDESGGDYWAVEIGEFGQLGTGNFKYSSKLDEIVK